MNGTAAGVGLNDRLVRIFGSSASLRDALVLLAAAALAIVLEMFVDLLPTLAGWSRQHPAWQIDTLFTLVFVLAIGFFAFAFRRMREIGAVARRRSEAEAALSRFRRDGRRMVLGDGRPAAPDRGRRPGARPPGGARQAACALAAASRATMPGRGTGPSSPAGSRFAAFASRSPTMPAASTTCRSAAGRSSIATAAFAAIAAPARTSPRSSPPKPRARTSPISTR